MDDICVHGKDMDEHDRRLEEVLKKIEESGLKLNMKKCHLRKSRRMSTTKAWLPTPASYVLQSHTD